MVHLDLQISLQILKKISGPWGKWLMKKTWSKRSPGTVPLNRIWKTTKFSPFPTNFVPKSKYFDPYFLYCTMGWHIVKTHSIPTGKLEAWIFFKSYFQGPSSQDQQKTFRRCFITFKVTLTGQSHFMLIYLRSSPCVPVTTCEKIRYKSFNRNCCQFVFELQYIPNEIVAKVTDKINLRYNDRYVVARHLFLLCFPPRPSRDLLFLTHAVHM